MCHVAVGDEFRGAEFLDRCRSGIRGVRGAGRWRGCGRGRAGVRAAGAADQRGQGVQVAEPSPRRREDRRRVPFQQPQLRSLRRSTRSLA